MKIPDYIEPDAGDLLVDPNPPRLGRSFVKRAGHTPRTLPPGIAAGRRPRPMDPPPLSDEIPVPISVSREAAYLMISDLYNPHNISPNELRDMTELLIAARIATRADQALLMRGPMRRGYPFLESGVRRDMVAEWQAMLAKGVGSSKLDIVSRATRALNILGQVSLTRLPKKE